MTTINHGSDQYTSILTRDSISFIAELSRQFNDQLGALMSARKDRQAKYDLGTLPDFLDETSEIREGDWTVVQIPSDLQDRRVEITGPPDRKMVINALNSGANIFMADFEDSLSPTWDNILSSQENLRDAVRREITYEHPTKGTYKLNDEVSVLFVRPRGLHLREENFLVDGFSVPASLFDFGLFLFHNAQVLIESESGPYFYLPKLEHHLEARWWNDVFIWAQEELGILPGTIRATVLIETLPAAFQMDEILYELRDHSAGLNCGRWDYIFSYIKTLRNHSDRVLPDRSLVTMSRKFMKSYSDLLIKTCHRRGVHAMGGMAAQIPIRHNTEANDKALMAVRRDKHREVTAGHDGTWVAHPGLVQVAKEIFDVHMKSPNQIDKTHNLDIGQDDLISTPEGDITEVGLRKNINVGILYLESWLRGGGCVPLYHLMEDAATAEISRTQVWQWLKHQKFSVGEFDKILLDEVVKIKEAVGSEKFNVGKYDQAIKLFRELSISSDLTEFLTLPAYDQIKFSHIDKD